MIAVLALVAVMAQDCDAMLPPPDARIEWFRNGRPYATDEPAGSGAGERRYRRQLTTGRSETRVLSCTSGGSLVDGTGSTSITVPLSLKVGATRRIGSATVQRIATPAGASRASLWYYISGLESQRVGVRAGVGIEEIQTLRKGSDVDVLFARVQRGGPAAASDSASSNANALNAARARVRQLELQTAGSRGIEIRLRDSIAALQRAVAAQPLMRDSIRSAVVTATAARRALDGGLRAVVDSAARLPSADEAWTAALLWPGAGQISVDRGGTGWAVVGGAAVAAAAASLALPASVIRDMGFEPDNARRVGFTASAAVYAGALLYARSLLSGTLDEMHAAGVTRESFLRRAEVTVGPDGTVRIVLRATR